jgi:hypothetical protein
MLYIIKELLILSWIKLFSLYFGHVVKVLLFLGKYTYQAREPKNLKKMIY